MDELEVRLLAEVRSGVAEVADSLGEALRLDQSYVCIRLRQDLHVGKAGHGSRAAHVHQDGEVAALRNEEAESVYVSRVRKLGHGVIVDQDRDRVVFRAGSDDIHQGCRRVLGDEVVEIRAHAGLDRVEGRVGRTEREGAGDRDACRGLLQRIRQHDGLLVYFQPVPGRHGKTVDDHLVFFHS